MRKHRLGLIVPYRNRYPQLVEFKSAIESYLTKAKIDYRLIIVEQDDAKLFNRGKLLNIGFLEAKKLKCDYVCFHDVDMVPSKVDYSYSETPVHLAHTLVNYDNTHKPIFDQYFGGVTIFPVEAFERINGYSNEYWGWGFEDDDLLYRVHRAQLPLAVKNLPHSGPKSAALKFNGYDSYVEVKNIIDYKKDFTLHLSYCPDEHSFDSENRDDMFVALGIPGYDLTIGFDSFNRYKVELFNSKEEYFQGFSIESSKKKVIVNLVYNAKLKRFKAYIDGKLIASERLNDKIYDYSKNQSIFLGCADPKREKDSKYFKGIIDSFAIFDKELLPTEINSIGTNQYFGLTSNFDEYISETALQLYYEAKFIQNYELLDLSKNNNNGIIKNCEIIKLDQEPTATITVPYRRIGRFKLMKHDDKGFNNNSWQDINTRYNQLRFNNEVKQNWHDNMADGLKNCKFRLYSSTIVEKVINIVVGI